MTRRFALYAAPPADHPLWSAGCDWLGRDAETGRAAPPGPWRAGPRRYGFHATLKPPFALRDGVDPGSLDEALAAFADARAAFAMPRLQVALLGDFLALRPADGEGAALRALADDCVRRFEPWRRPPTDTERAARLARPLSPVERANVDTWGYPYVFAAWRFHMTLTDALPAGEAGAPLRRALHADAERHFASALDVPLVCDGIALFVEDAPGADVRLARRIRFGR